jgi:alpha-1,3-rhamnosyltransferase
MGNNIISIIVPVYNHQKYIVNCLNSIKNQKNCNIELLICDDCSSDESYRIAKGWVDQNRDYFFDVKLIRNDENLGVAKTCNKMIKNSSGEYIKILASDDMLMLNSLEDYILFLEANNELDLAFSNGFHVINTAGYPLQKMDIRKKIYDSKPLMCGRTIFDELYKKDFIAAPTVLYRKRTFSQYGVFTEKYVFEDYEYYLRIGLKGKIGYYDSETVLYRDSENSLSRFSNDENGKVKFRKFVKDQQDLLEEYGSFTSMTMDIFWDNALGTAMQIHDDEFISNVLNNKEIKIAPRRQLLVIAYRLRLYDFIKRICRR